MLNLQLLTGVKHKKETIRVTVKYHVGKILIQRNRPTVFRLTISAGWPQE